MNNLARTGVYSLKDITLPIPGEFAGEVTVRVSCVSGNTTIDLFEGHAFPNDVMTARFIAPAGLRKLNIKILGFHPGRESYKVIEEERSL